MGRSALAYAPRRPVRTHWAAVDAHAGLEASATDAGRLRPACVRALHLRTGRSSARSRTTRSSWIRAMTGGSSARRRDSSGSAVRPSVDERDETRRQRAARRAAAANRGTSVDDSARGPPLAASRPAPARARAIASTGRPPSAAPVPSRSRGRRDARRGSPRARRTSACRRAARASAGAAGRVDQRRARPTMMPACGPPSSLSPLKQTTSDAGGEAWPARTARRAGIRTARPRRAYRPLPRSSTTGIGTGVRARPARRAPGAR